MFTLIRTIGGGPKNRMKEDGFNLDLTYITPRIIAMAFPS
jgi:phosphatidylinositol-3,4,5-trisphosphate 3-phosphatase/dual-specificity protein phosphatase PTEN